ncbi:hypothetical protein [Candidatus Palauibacter sp.]|uniref:hypothetical protein n=1 Tax=Candidatus Palauibacter sp. TaxID=3101350 RepID=UPI003CC5E2EF
MLTDFQEQREIQGHRQQVPLSLFQPTRLKACLGKDHVNFFGIELVDRQLAGRWNHK